jgi:hypothetical protein
VRLKRLIVRWTETACSLTHPITLRRPWLWLPLPICPLASYSATLDKRWGTGVWKPIKDSDG